MFVLNFIVSPRFEIFAFCLVDKKRKINEYNLFLQLTGNESKIDLWMLSKLSYATQVCDDGFAKYDFNGATTACYNLWLYDLCDVYLVRKLKS